MNFVKGYKDNNTLRNSFNQLASHTFGLNFEKWYEKGFWTNKYEPFSFEDKGEIVANVSVNHISLILNGKEKRSLQIGTVMTHPHFRNKGLSRKLMNLVLESYENQYDLMYLFANDTVLDFYPKFGFQRMSEFLYSMDYKVDTKQIHTLTKLDGLNDHDLRFIYEYSKRRTAVSNLFGTINTEELLMFYCLYVFSNDIYYIKDLDNIVIFQKQGNELHLYDVISRNIVNIEEVLVRIADNRTEKVIFHYQPDYKTIQTDCNEITTKNNVLFIKTEDKGILPLCLKHPQTAQA